VKPFLILFLKNIPKKTFFIVFWDLIAQKVALSGYYHRDVSIIIGINDQLLWSILKKLNLISYLDNK